MIVPDRNARPRAKNAGTTPFQCFAGMAGDMTGLSPIWNKTHGSSFKTNGST